MGGKIAVERECINPQVGHQSLQLSAVVVVVEPEGGDAKNIDGGFFGFTLWEFAFLASFFDVELDDLFQSTVGSLQLVDALVVDVSQHDIAFGIQLRSIYKVLQIFLQNAGSTSRSEDNEIGLLLFVFACDVVDHLFLRAAS